MNYEFSTKEELFKRVRPALRAKEVEFHRLGHSYIKDIDIWNYLIQEKWINGKNLMLSDIVNDIMHVDLQAIAEHIRGKISKSRREQYHDNNLEVI